MFQLFDACFADELLIRANFFIGNLLRITLRECSVESFNFFSVVTSTFFFCNPVSIFGVIVLSKDVMQRYSANVCIVFERLSPSLVRTLVSWNRVVDSFSRLAVDSHNSWTLASKELLELSCAINQG